MDGQTIFFFSQTKMRDLDGDLACRIVDRWCNLLFLKSEEEQRKNDRLLEFASLCKSDQSKDETAAATETVTAEIFSTRFCTPVERWIFYCQWSDWFRRICLLWNYIEEEQEAPELLDYLKSKMDFVKKINGCLELQQGFGELPFLENEEDEVHDFCDAVDIDAEREDWKMMERSAFLAADWLSERMKAHFS